MRHLFHTNAPAATFLVRILVGSVFLSEGIQKFLFPAELGAGRFAKIGVPAPDIMGPFVGACEVVCGALLIIGLLTRLAAIVLRIKGAQRRLDSVAEAGYALFDSWTQ